MCDSHVHCQSSLDWSMPAEYYGLENHMHRQLLQSPLRVFSASESDLIYVPFYAQSMLRGSDFNCG